MSFHVPEIVGEKWWTTQFAVAIMIDLVVCIQYSFVSSEFFARSFVGKLLSQSLYVNFSKTRSFTCILCCLKIHFYIT